MTSHPVFLLTDFGTADPFVGIMKAVIAGLSPNSRIFDLTHQIAPQNVLHGAVAAEDSWPWLPDGAIICAVVDPGVGGSRRAIAGRVGQKLIVAPDNGLLTPILNKEPEKKLVALAARGPVRPERSSTFHGRDVFAPAAGLLARGETLESLGEPVEDFQPLLIPQPETNEDGHLLLRILSIDHFGNLTLNLTRREAENQWPWVDNEKVRAQCGGKMISSLSRTFADVEKGQLLLYWNSFERLEIGLNHGNAEKKLGCGAGDFVVLERVPRE